MVRTQPKPKTYLGRLLVKHGMTQYRMAKLMGKTSSVITHWSLGTRNPRIENLDQFVSFIPDLTLEERVHLYASYNYVIPEVRNLSADQWLMVLSILNGPESKQYAA